MIRDLMEAQAADLKRLQGRAQARALRLTKAKLAEVRAELAKLELGSWGWAERTAVMRRLQAAVSELSRGQVDLLAEGLGDTARVSARNAATWLRSLDKQYLGVARPLRFDTIEWIDNQATAVSKVRLRQYAKSFARYGAAAVEAIEDEVAKAVLSGEPWTVARKKVMAATSQAVGGRQWMVDRILRTETSAAYNATQLDALIEEDDDVEDPMMKRLVATFDSRTGRDSLGLHGQTVPVKQPFFDPYFGITYQAPPNRPHDREIVVGWRASYGDEFVGGDRGYVVDTATPTDDAAFVIPGASAARAEGPIAIRQAMLSGNLRDYRRQLLAAQRRRAVLTDAAAKEVAAKEVDALVARINAVKAEQDQITRIQELLQAKRAELLAKRPKADWVSVGDAAKKLGVSPSTLQSAIKSGKVKSKLVDHPTRAGKKLRVVDLEDAERYAKSRRKVTRKKPTKKPEVEKPKIAAVAETPEAPKPVVYPDHVEGTVGDGVTKVAKLNDLAEGDVVLVDGYMPARVKRIDRPKVPKDASRWSTFDTEVELDLGGGFTYKRKIAVDTESEILDDYRFWRYDDAATAPMVPGDDFTETDVAYLIARRARAEERALVKSWQARADPDSMTFMHRGVELSHRDLARYTYRRDAPGKDLGAWKAVDEKATRLIKEDFKRRAKEVADEAADLTTLRVVADDVESSRKALAATRDFESKHVLNNTGTTFRMKKPVDWKKCDDKRSVAVYARETDQLMEELAFAPPKIHFIEKIPPKERASAWCGWRGDWGASEIDGNPFAKMGLQQKYTLDDARRQSREMAKALEVGDTPWTVGPRVAKRNALKGAEGLDADLRASVVEVATTARHEFGHAIDHHLQYLAARGDVEAKAILSLWEEAVEEVNKATRKIKIEKEDPVFKGLTFTTEQIDASSGWGRVSSYAASKPRVEGLAETFSLATANMWDDIPEPLHLPLRLMLRKKTTREVAGATSEKVVKKATKRKKAAAPAKPKKPTPRQILETRGFDANTKRRRSRLLKVVEKKRAKAKAAAVIDERGQAWDLRAFGDGGVVGENAEVVWVDPKKLNREWHTGWIGHGGDGGIGDRYDDFGWFLDDADMPIQPSELSLSDNNLVLFENGRHRFAVFRDRGYERIPVVVPSDQAARVRKIAGVDPPKLSKP